MDEHRGTLSQSPGDVHVSVAALLPRPKRVSRPSMPCLDRSRFVLTQALADPPQTEVSHYHETMGEALQGVELQSSGAEIRFRGMHGQPTSLLRSLVLL